MDIQQLIKEWSTLEPSVVVFDEGGVYGDGPMFMYIPMEDDSEGLLYDDFQYGCSLVKLAEVCAWVEHAIMSHGWEADAKARSIKGDYMWIVTVFSPEVQAGGRPYIVGEARDATKAVAMVHAYLLALNEYLTKALPAFMRVKHYNHT